MKYNKASVQSVEFPPVISRCLDQREVKLGLYNSLSLSLNVSRPCTLTSDFLFCGMPFLQQTSSLSFDLTKPYTWLILRERKKD